MDPDRLRENFESHLSEAADTEAGVRDEQVAALDAAHSTLVEALAELDEQNRS